VLQTLPQPLMMPLQHPSLIRRIGVLRRGGKGIDDEKAGRLGAPNSRAKCFF